jgi:hypothetical protein
MEISKELEEFLSSSFKLRKVLEPVLPKEAVDYILTLIAQDGAHRNFLKVTEEIENEQDRIDECKEPNQ